MFIVSNSKNEEVAACKYMEDAACLVAFLGEFSFIQSHGQLVWKEGLEIQSAYESYDFVAGTIERRINAARINQK